MSLILVMVYYTKSGYENTCKYGSGVLLSYHTFIRANRNVFFLSVLYFTVCIDNLPIIREVRQMFHLTKMWLTINIKRQKKKKKKKIIEQINLHS